MPRASSRKQFYATLAASSGNPKQKPPVEGPIRGLVVAEARASLSAVLEEVDKDPKEVGTAWIGVTINLEFHVFHSCRDIDLAWLITVPRR